MINQELLLFINELNADKNMKRVILELLIYEISAFDEINNKYMTKYDNLVEKYLRMD